MREELSCWGQSEQKAGKWWQTAGEDGDIAFCLATLSLLFPLLCLFPISSFLPVSLYLFFLLFFLFPIFPPLLFPFVTSSPSPQLLLFSSPSVYPLIFLCLSYPFPLQHLLPSFPQFITFPSHHGRWDRISQINTAEEILLLIITHIPSWIPFLSFIEPYHNSHLIT